MHDQITRLCTRLIDTERPDEIHPVARELQRAIRARVDRVRESAEVAFLDRPANFHGFIHSPEDNYN